MILKGKVQDNPLTFGFVEKYEYYSYNKNRNLKLVTTLTHDGSLGIPYLYFANEFVNLYDAADELAGDGLRRYIQAKKPIHSILDGNSDIVSMHIRSTEKGVTHKIRVLKPNPKASDSTRIQAIEIPPTTEIESAGIRILDTLLNTECSRYAYLQARKSLV